MGKIAFVFSGQGDQYPGMGKEIADRYETAKRIFDMCDGIRQGTSSQCFEGTAEELKETINTQPCLYAMELAAACVIAEKGIVPDMTAGFSLGEVTAAAFSGLFDYETGFKAVCRRGELMQEAAEEYDTSMAAVVKLEEKKVQELCDKYSKVYPVNYNCPGQVSVSGLKEQMSEFSEDVKLAGGRALPLKVKGAFHSPFMKEASEKFKKFLQEEIEEKGHLYKRKIDLYSDATSFLYGDDVIGLLSEQICMPVLWERVIRNMIAAGADTFIEIGPGNTLTNMIRKIDPSVKADNYMHYIQEAEIC